MYLKSLFALLIGFTAWQTLAQPHVHGKGALVIAQDENLWQLQYTLPAADVFGFEHQPENAEQTDIVRSRGQLLKDSNNLVNLPPDCDIKDHQLELPFYDDAAADHADVDHSHDKDYDHSHEHHHEDTHNDEDERGHNDVEATLVIECESTLTNLNISLFKSFSSIESLDVVWAIAAGQGSQTVTVKAPTVNMQ